MAQGVIDNLEVVDIEEQDRETGLPPARDLHSVRQVLPEESPVGQAGQIVMQGSTAQLTRRDREFGGPVSDPTLDLPERSLEFLAEEVDASCDGIDDVPVGTHQRASLELERRELLNCAHDVLQASLETLIGPADRGRRLRRFDWDARCVLGA
jgi:hypothetical protein